MLLEKIGQGHAANAAKDANTSNDAKVADIKLWLLSELNFKPLDHRNCPYCFQFTHFEFKF